jgi:hypothetical protein
MTSTAAQPASTADIEARLHGIVRSPKDRRMGQP